MYLQLGRELLQRRREAGRGHVWVVVKQLRHVRRTDDALRDAESVNAGEIDDRLLDREISRKQANTSCERWNREIAWVIGEYGP